MKIMDHERPGSKPTHHIDNWMDEHLACLPPAVLANLPGAVVGRNVISERMRKQGIDPREAATKPKSYGVRPGSIADQCRAVGMKKGTVTSRMSKGWTLHDALNTPPMTPQESARHAARHAKKG